MTEIINDVADGSYNKTLDFDSYIYMAVPIGEVPSVDSFTYLSLPYGTTAAPRIQHTKIENVEELKAFIQEKE
jgi:hypothetical protein